MARATSSLPVPLSPVISTVRSLPCRRWIWSTTRCIAALAQTKPGSSGSSGRSTFDSGPPSRAFACAAELEALARHRRHHLHAPHHRMAGGPRRGHRHGAGAVRIASDLLGDQDAGAVGGALHRQAGDALGRRRHRCRRGRRPGCRLPAAARTPSPCRRRPPRASRSRARAPAGLAARRHPPGASPAHRQRRRASRRTHRCRVSAPPPSPPVRRRGRASRRAPETPGRRSDSAGRTWISPRPWRPAAPMPAG